MLTIEQAKTKWCPFVKLQVPGGIVNRIGRAMIRMRDKMRAQGTDLRDADYIDEQIADSNCLADGCACWRRLAVIEEHDGANFRVYRGYCGLAGRPDAE